MLQGVIPGQISGIGPASSFGSDAEGGCHRKVVGHDDE
jgi:hypothetical protein